MIYAKSTITRHNWRKRISASSATSEAAVPFIYRYRFMLTCASILMMLMHSKAGDVMLVYPFFCTDPLPPPGPTPPRPPPPPPPPGPAQKHGARLLTEAYAKMITLLLEFTTTPGELGMLAAHEGANWPSKFGQCRKEIKMCTHAYRSTHERLKRLVCTVLANWFVCADLCSTLVR